MTQTEQEDCPQGCIDGWVRVIDGGELEWDVCDCDKGQKPNVDNDKED